jgi:hypothetical protein
MILKLSAKCSDMFTARLFTNTGKQVGSDYSGYVPKFFPEEHYGDYIMLNIDTDTGKIINWKPPTDKKLTEIFEQ